MSIDSVYQSAMTRKRVSDCYNSDMKEGDYWDRTRTVWLQDGGESESGACDQEFDERNSHKAHLSKVVSYPACVTEGIERTVRKNGFLFIGWFDEIDHPYCICDHDIYIWPFSGTNADVVKLEDHNRETIIAAAVIVPEKAVYYHPNVKNVLLYVTNSSVHIIPIVMEDGKYLKLLLRRKIQVKLNFVATAVAVAEKEESWVAFIGSNAGDVYGLYCFLDEHDNFYPKAEVIGLTVNDWWMLGLSMLGSENPVLQISYDESRALDFLAVLYNESVIRFFKYDKRKLVEVYVFNPVEIGYIEAESWNAENGAIKVIETVPVSDSDAVRFVAFTEKGVRLFFGVIPGFSAAETQFGFRWLDGNMYRVRRLPEKFGDQSLYGASYRLNQSVLLFDQSIVVMRPRHRMYRPSLGHDEVYQVLELSDGPSCRYEDKCVNFVRGKHEFSRTRSPLIRHEFMWQHILGRQVGFLLCTTGIRTLTIDRPVDTMRRIIEENKDHMGVAMNWMTTHSNVQESFVCILLMMSEEMQGKDGRERVKSLSRVFENSKAKGYKEDSSKLEVHAFFVRVARILALVWNEPIFTKVEGVDKWTCSYVFKQCSEKVMKDLEVVLELRQIVDAGVTRETRGGPLEKLMKFVKKQINILKFVSKIVAQSKNPDAMAAAMKGLDERLRQRLCAEPFGKKEKDVKTPLEALHQFVIELLATGSNTYFVDALIRDFPNMFSRESIDLIRKVSILKKRPPDYKEAAHDIDEVRRLHHVIVEAGNARIPDLGAIVECFRKFGHLTGIVEICLEKANVVDPRQDALRWYRGSRGKDDIKGCQAFDRRLECYSHCFQGDWTSKKEAFDLMRASTDELFHVCMYTSLCNVGNPNDNTASNRLCELTTPFIVPFLEDYESKLNSGPLLGLYYMKHGEYKRSAESIMTWATEYWKTMKQATGDSIAFILSNLECASALARASGHAALEKKTRHMVKSIGIQNALHVELATQERRFVSDQELWDICCRLERWDLVLNILSYSDLERERSKVISTVWCNFLEVPFASLSQIQGHVVQTARDIDINSDVMDPAIVMPVLEQYRVSRNGYGLWAMDTMLEAGMDPTRILHVYVDALLTVDNLTINENEKNCRCDWIYVISVLLKRGADLKGKSIAPIKAWFEKNGMKCEYFSQVRQNFISA